MYFDSGFFPPAVDKPRSGLQGIIFILAFFIDKKLFFSLQYSFMLKHDGCDLA
jgi:hypothetical protein